jgi:hypothetical protein
MPYVFRLESTKKSEQLPEAGRRALFQQMKSGRLRQGWGRDGMGLLDKKGNPIPRDEWVKHFLEAAEGWPAKERTVKKARGHYGLLSTMLKIRPGDRIVVPNFAEDGWQGLVIATAVPAPRRPEGKEGECYGFSPAPSALNGDRRHYIAIKPLFKSIPLSREGKNLRRLIGKGGYRVRVREVNGKLHPELVRVIARLAQADITEPTETLKKAKVAKPPDDKQRARGLAGEEEIIERLEGGFLGFSLKEDRRTHGCGYDFLAHDGKKLVEIEVKTFDARSGQIFFTEKELEQALTSHDRFQLWALLDNGLDPSMWELRILSAPHPELQRVGEKQVSVVYRIPPLEVTWEKQIEGLTSPRKRKKKKRPVRAKRTHSFGDRLL